MKINAKTFAGVGLGLVAGYFIVKSKKPLYIAGIGLAGGLLANLIFNMSNENPITLSTKNYIDKSEEELIEEDMSEVDLYEEQ